MADPISGAAVQQLVEQNIAQQPQDRIAADPAEQSRFENAMSGADGTQQAGEVGGIDGVNGTMQIQEPGAADKTGPVSMGDAILDGFDRLKVNHDGRMNSVTAALQEVQDAPMSVGSAMKLQFELMQMSLEQDLTTKVADKASQGVQTLFKNS